MLQPKKTKFRKQQKGKIKGNTKRGAEIAFGSFALKALEPALLTGRQIEAARQAVTRYMKREGQLWIRVFPDKPITKKPNEVRMGKVRGHRNISSLGWHPAVSCSKPTVFRKKSPKKPCVWRLRSCRLR